MGDQVKLLFQTFVLYLQVLQSILETRDSDDLASPLTTCMKGFTTKGMNVKEAVQETRRAWKGGMEAGARDGRSMALGELKPDSRGQAFPVVCQVCHMHRILTPV